MKVLSDSQVAQIIKATRDVRVPIVYATSTVGDNAIISITPIGCCDIEVKDPRYDTDAALELLGFVMTTMEKDARDRMLEMDVEWSLMVYDGDSHPWDTGVSIPISGEPFRAAVCNLAAEVLGVAQ